MGGSSNICCGGGDGMLCGTGGRTKGLVQMLSPNTKKSSCLPLKIGATYHHSMLSVMSATTTFGLSSADKVTVLEKRATAIRVNGAILPTDCLIANIMMDGMGWSIWLK